MATDIVNRIGNMIMRAREALIMNSQGSDHGRLDGWIGRECWMRFKRDLSPLNFHLETDRPYDDRIKFLGVPIMLDKDMAPGLLILHHNGQVIRRLYLDRPDFDSAPIADNPDIEDRHMRALQYIGQERQIENQHGFKIADYKPLAVCMPSDDLVEPIAMETTHSSELERLGFISVQPMEFKQGARVFLTMAGRTALAQWEARAYKSAPPLSPMSDTY